MESKFIVHYTFRYNPKSKNKKDNNIENFYTHHRMKIYDNTCVEKIWMGEEKKEFSFDISEELLSEYKNMPEVYCYLERMKDFKKIYSVTIQPNRSIRFRTDVKAKYYWERYQECKKENFDHELCSKYAEKAMVEEYETEEGRKKHASENLQPKYNYFITIFSKALSGLLQQVFVSTLAYEQSGIEWPENVDRESFSFEFDMENKTATLIDIKIYNPNNPYNKYIRRSMRIIHKQNINEENDKDIINFYLENRITPWITYDEKDFVDKMKSEDNIAGIYMLYDSEKKYFYVGKAEHVFKRMKEHRDSNELINSFNYYRYSLIDPSYYDDIFLIENTAIHDAAMILTMERNSDYKEKSLSKALPEDINIQDITMVNNQKMQTKRPGTKQKK